MSVFQILERFNRFNISEKTNLVEFRIEKVIVYKIGDIKLYFTIVLLRLFPVPEFFDLFLEESEIERKSRIVSFPRLFNPKDITRTANF